MKKTLKGLLIFSFAVCLFSFAGCIKLYKLFNIDDSYIDDYIGGMKVVHYSNGGEGTVTITDKSEIKKFVKDFNKISLTIHPAKLIFMQGWEPTYFPPEGESVLFNIVLLNNENESVALNGAKDSNSFSVYTDGTVFQAGISPQDSSFSGKMPQNLQNKLADLF